ncbi:MAG TPA: hypothetical protein PKM73_16245 [Verrucomicrobiota bacterium]|nr:hypothetical protein [Verrucomicrobiota bacterium]HNU52847.1 hypothetical protein [Verrucomicrobiota bacterium]
MQLTKPVLALLGANLLATVLLLGQPVVTNYTTSIYAVVPDPQALAFGADGALYVGRDNHGSSGGYGDAVKIHRVAPGGAAVAEFGEVAVSDPDALIVDVAGVVSGTAGAVLVGGVHNNTTTGKIVAFAPEGTSSVWFGPNATLYNPSAFAFDASGRLLITEAGNGKVLVSSGAMPTVLFSLTDVIRIAVDTLDRIVVNTSTGTALRLYTSGGVLSNANFAAVKANCPLARGPGGSWGTDLYAVAPNGDLVRIDLEGGTTRVGSGFSNAAAFAFGPDAALYVSDFDADRIYRIAQPNVPGAVTTIHARVTDPARLSFAPDGTLFVGRDNTGSGGDWTDAVKIHRIGPGGSPVEEYGASAITDPDAVVYDADGSASGIPGAVIVAGTQLNSSNGKIVTIRPDQTITTLYGPTAFAFNPNVFAYDVNGRLLASDDLGGKVWTLESGVPQVLFSMPDAVHLAVDTLNRIVIGAADKSTLRLYGPEGVLITNAFANVTTNSPLARGPGGFWGSGVFGVATNGTLLSLDTNGVATAFGTGFGNPWAIAFGPDDALYVSEFKSDLIWRIAPGVTRPRLAITRYGTQVQLSWETLEGRQDQLQSTPQLPATVWLDEGSPFPGAGGLVLTNLTIGPQPAMFFRLESDK